MTEYLTGKLEVCKALFAMGMTTAPEESNRLEVLASTRCVNFQVLPEEPFFSDYYAFMIDDHKISTYTALVACGHFMQLDHSTEHDDYVQRRITVLKKTDLAKLCIGLLEDVALEYRKRRLTPKIIEVYDEL